MRQSKKWKSYGEKKAGIPLARIGFVKDKNAASKKGLSNVGAVKRNGSKASTGKGKGGGSSTDRSDQKADSKQPKIVIAKLKPSKIDRNPLSGAALRKRMDKKNAAAEKGKKSKVADMEMEMEEQPCPFDSLIFLGDLNYRLDLPRLEVRAITLVCNMLRHIISIPRKNCLFFLHPSFLPLSSHLPSLSLLCR